MSIRREGWTSRSARELEEPAPLDDVSRRKLAKAPEVGVGGLREDRDVLHLGVQLILAADHAVPEAIRGDREFDGHERAALPSEELQHDLECLHDFLPAVRRDRERVGLEHIANHVFPHEPHQEVVDDRPLEMPPDDPPRFVESLVCGCLRKGIDHLVVVLQESEGELRHDQVLIVPRIAEQCPPVRVAGQVVVSFGVPADQEVDPVGVVDEGDIVGPAAVERVEVQARRPEIRQGVRIVVALQLGCRVERKVVVDELPKIREPRGDVRIVAALVLRPRFRLRLDHLLRQFAKRRVPRQERRQVPEHASEATLEHRGSHDGLETAWLGSMEVLLGHRFTSQKAAGLVPALTYDGHRG